MPNKYVIIDFETTGLEPLTDEVVEIAAIKYEGAKKIDEFEVILKPSVKVHPKALATHGLTDKFLAENGHEPGPQWKKLAAFIGKCDLVAHNGLGFDFQFINNAFQKHKIEVGENKLLDSLPLSQKHLKTRTGKYKLAHLCEAYSITNDRAHRAMSDVKALSQVFKLLRKEVSDLTEMWNSSGGFTLDRLSELPAGFELMHRAIEDGLDIKIDYQGAEKPRSQRWIRPHGVFYRHGHRYVVGLCLEKNDQRQFRTDRFFGVLKTRKRE